MGVIRLHEVQAAPDSQVVEAAALLLRLAKDGKITGLAYVALQRGNEYSADVSGAARRYPILALGVTKILEQVVIKLLAPVE